MKLSYNLEKKSLAVIFHFFIKSVIRVILMNPFQFRYNNIHLTWKNIIKIIIYVIYEFKNKTWDKTTKHNNETIRHKYFFNKIYVKIQSKG